MLLADSRDACPYNIYNSSASYLGTSPYTREAVYRLSVTHSPSVLLRNPPPSEMEANKPSPAGEGGPSLMVDEELLCN